MTAGLRFAGAVILLAGTGLFLRTQKSREVIPQHEEFSLFPRQVGDWVGTDLTIPPDSLAVLGSGEFLLRNYQKLSADATPVQLFLAYFPTQRIAETFHSPKHCLPGDGWLPLESHTFSVALPGMAPVLANRYLVAKGGRRALVIYWYKLGERTVASEYAAKFYLIADSIRFQRSDGSLIRLSTEIRSDESAASAERRLISLLAGVVPVLDRYIPR